jgi:CBS-domain-containing membrane protein
MKGLLISKLYESARQFASDVRQANLFSFAPNVTVSEADTFEQLLSKLAATRMHRVYMKDDKEHPTGVISLIDVIKAIINIDADPDMV